MSVQNDTVGGARAALHGAVRTFNSGSKYAVWDGFTILCDGRGGYRHERRLDTADFFEFLTDVLDEWSGDDVDELFELLETQLGEVGIDLKTDAKAAAEDEEEADEPEGEDDDVGDMLDDDEDSEDEDDEESSEDSDED